MKFGTIGAGAVALAFAREALARGHEVVLSSRRGPDALADKVAELGRGASAASVEKAASLEYVLLAVPWRNVESALKGLPAWNGRVLIDATNPFVETTPKLVFADLGGKGASEVVAALAVPPGAGTARAALPRRRVADEPAPVHGEGDRSCEGDRGVRNLVRRTAVPAPAVVLGRDCLRGRSACPTARSPVGCIRYRRRAAALPGDRQRAWEADGRCRDDRSSR